MSFIQQRTIPVYFVWLKYISWYYYAYDAYLIVVFENYGPITCSQGNSMITESMMNFTDASTTDMDTFSNSTCSTKPNRCYENGLDVLDSYFVKTVI